MVTCMIALKNLRLDRLLEWMDLEPLVVPVRPLTKEEAEQVLEALRECLQNEYAVCVFRDLAQDLGGNLPGLHFEINWDEEVVE